MRTFSILITSVLAGVLLWWIAAMVGTAIFSGMGFPDQLSLIPGYLYTYVFGGTYFAAKFSYIGVPVCIAIAAVVVVVPTTTSPRTDRSAHRSVRPHSGPS